MAHSDLERFGQIGKDPLHRKTEDERSRVDQPETIRGQFSTVHLGRFPAVFFIETKPEIRTQGIRITRLF